MLKKNLIANYIGNAWSALMSLLFVPGYIQYIGIEAYGLIGLFAMLQAWLSLLDMGMTPSLGREMARFTGGGHTAQSIRDLLRSVEWIAVGIGLIIALGVVGSAHWLATSWLKAEGLPISQVARAFTIMGLVTALRFVEGVYRSSIVGLQRQVLFNTINGIMATVRGVGALGVLAWVSPTIEAFFIWQALVSVAMLGVLASATYSSLPRSGQGGRFSRTALKGVWRFAGGMLGITFLALLLTQVDKILLSKLLSLKDFGYYTLAATVAGSLHLLIGPITQAWYPRLCALYAAGDEKELAKTYHQGAQLVSAMAGSAAMILIFFSEPLLYLWTQDEALANRVAPILSLLAFGNLLNGLMWIPYQTQLAHGWTRLSIYINMVAVLLIVPAILWITPRYGAEGAAWAWIALNAGYILIGVQFMYRRIMTTEKWYWYRNDLLAPIGMATLVSGIFRFAWSGTESLYGQLLLLAAASCAVFGSAVLAAGYMRKQVLDVFASSVEKQEEIHP